MDDKEYIEEDLPVEESVEESDDELVDSDAMSGAEGGFTKGAEGDMNFDDDEEDGALDDDERISD